MEKFAAVFSGEVYHIKAADKSQHFFYIFLYFFFGAIFRPGGRGILKGKQTGGSSRYSGLPPVWPAIPIAAARLLSDTVPGPELSGPDMRWGARHSGGRGTWQSQSHFHRLPAVPGFSHFPLFSILSLPLYQISRGLHLYPVCISRIICQRHILHFNDFHGLTNGPGFHGQFHRLGPRPA